MGGGPIKALSDQLAQRVGDGLHPDAFAAKNIAVADPGPKHSPLSPHSPRPGSGADDLGKEGKEGKVLDVAVGDGVISPDTRGAPGWRGRL